MAPKNDSGSGHVAKKHPRGPKVLPSGSGAVMASRRSTPDGLDDFPTPPFATRALIETVLRGRLSVGSLGRVAEPCANRGIMSDVLAEYSNDVLASDVFDYGYGIRVADFLDRMYYDPPPRADWYITNPPFSAALEMVLRALSLADIGGAFLLRTQWLEGEERYDDLFSKTPPTLIATFVERVAMCEGRWDPDLKTATSYTWFVWMRRDRWPDEGELIAPHPFFWIPPGQKRTLTRADDRRRFASRGLQGEGTPLLSPTNGDDS